MHNFNKNKFRQQPDLSFAPQEILALIAKKTNCQPKHYRPAIYYAALLMKTKRQASQSAKVTMEGSCFIAFADALLRQSATHWASK